jgi:hypothetical protein
MFEEHMSRRRSFRQRYPHRRNHQGCPFPKDLAEPQPFTQWLHQEVALEEEDQTIPNPSNDIIWLSQRSSPRATKYRSMSKFGNYYRVVSVECHLKMCDSGIEATFTHPCISGIQNRNPILVNIKYVG